MCFSFFPLGQITLAKRATQLIRLAGRSLRKLPRHTIFEVGGDKRYVIINPMTKEVDLVSLSSPGCVICKQFEEFWHGIEHDWPNVKYRNVDVTTDEGQELVGKYMIFASPGIIINGELFSTGGFDKLKFIEKLKELSQQK